jgi:hypothetical protein
MASTFHPFHHNGVPATSSHVRLFSVIIYCMTFACVEPATTAVRLLLLAITDRSCTAMLTRAP